MKILNSVNDFPKLDRVFISIGNFDGFHIGHQKIIEEMKESCGEKYPLFVITFRHAPLTILKPEKFKGYIFPLNYKEKIFEKIGIDFLASLDFREVKDWDKEKFVMFLKSRFREIYLFIGEDFRFGKNNEGEVKFLTKEIQNVKVIKKVKYENFEVSSSLIRNLLQKGEIEKANKMLSRPFFICSEVEKGDGIGSKIGFPTLNLKENEQVIPAIGIYFTLYRLEKKIFPAMTYIGTRPTLGKNSLRNETNILEIDNESIKILNEKEKHCIYFIKKIREEKRLHNLEELKNLLYNDRKVVLDLFKIYNDIGGLKDESFYGY